MSTRPTIQLGEFCRLFGFAEREARYVLEQGHVPDGVRHAPSRGNRRAFDAGQAFWMALVLKLKQFGLKTRLAARAADFTVVALRATTQSAGWDWHFLPMQGWFDTEHAYFVDVADFRHIRLVTDAHPSRDGLTAGDWMPVEGPRRPVRDLRPVVTLRLDLVEIARVLKQVPAWAESDDGPADGPSVRK